MSDIRSANVGQELRRPLSLALLALALFGVDRGDMGDCLQRLEHAQLHGQD